MTEKGVFNATDIVTEKIFEQCPNCKQAFQGDLLYDLTKVQLSFVEREFKNVQRCQLGALVHRIIVLDGKREEDRVEGEEICAKMLSLVDDMKKKSDPLLDVALTGVYQTILVFYFKVGTKCCLEKAKYYGEKVRDVIIASENGKLQWLVKSSENNIAKIEARINGSTTKQNTADEVSNLRARYNYLLRNTGECSVVTIQSGIELATVLFGAYHTIEAVRLLKTLVATSRRVHGSGHQRTKDAVLLLEKSLERYVFIESKLYQALRYENDGNSCVVEGPVPNEIALGERRKFDNEKIFSIASADIKVVFGTPVVLHGLKKAAHLNGKIGDVRDYCQSTDRYMLYLEDKGLKPVKVKHGNFRVVFDLYEIQRISTE